MIFAEIKRSDPLIIYFFFEATAFVVVGFLALEALLADGFFAAAAFAELLLLLDELRDLRALRTGLFQSTALSARNARGIVIMPSA